MAYYIYAVDFNGGETPHSHQHANTFHSTNTLRKDAKVSSHPSLHQSTLFKSRSWSVLQTTPSSQRSAVWGGDKSMDMSSAVFLSLSWLILQLANGELDYTSHGQGMQLRGNFTIAGLFPLHKAVAPSASLPALVPCDEWVLLFYWP